MKLTSAKANLMILTAAVLWGGGFVATKLALGADVSATTLVFLRFAVSALIFLIPALPKLKSSTYKTVLKGVLLGAIYSVGFLAQTFGMELTTTGKASFITGLNIIFVPFIYWVITKKRPPWRSFVAVVVCIAGLALLTLDFSGAGVSVNNGDLLVLLAAFSFAFHICFIGIFSKTESASAMIFFMDVSAAVICGIYMLFNGGFVFSTSFTSLASVGYCIVFATAVPSFLQTVGQSKTSSDVAALILASESVFGCIFAAIFLRETMTVPMYFGCALMLAGTVISQLHIGKKHTSGT